MHVQELVLGLPVFFGQYNVCRTGPKGVWHSGVVELNLAVWRLEWPANVQKELVTDKKPDSTIYILDLEMTGILLHYVVLDYLVDLQHQSIGAFCNNTPTVSWSSKLVSKPSEIARRLPRVLALQ